MRIKIRGRKITSLTFSSHFLSSLRFSASLPLPSITLSLFPTHSISLSPLLSIQVSSFLSHQLFPRLHSKANKLSFIQFRFSLNTVQLKWDLSSDLWLFPEPILNFYCRRPNSQRQTPTSLWKLNLLYLFTVTNFSSSLVSQNKLNPDVSAFCVSQFTFEGTFIDNYIYAFGRIFYPKQLLQLHIYQYVFYLGIKPITLMSLVPYNASTIHCRSNNTTRVQTFTQAGITDIKHNQHFQLWSHNGALKL